jgi:hypothetical protein
MSTEPYKVVVVVDPVFGNRLSDITRGVPVWIVDTPVNRAAAERMWAQRPGESHLTGITIFKAPADSGEEALLAEIDTIDLHHRAYSASPPYSILEVIGASLTDRIKNKLRKYGFEEFHSSSRGFIAVRAASDL